VNSNHDVMKCKLSFHF